MLTLITQSLYNFSQPDCYRMHPSHKYICPTSHILWENLQVYIEGTVEQEKEHKLQGASMTLGIG